MHLTCDALPLNQLHSSTPFSSATTTWAVLANCAYACCDRIPSGSRPRIDGTCLDTTYASHAPEGDDLAVDEILAQVAALGCGHVVLTGGEPMLFAKLVPLAAGLRSQRRHVTIETAGTLYLDVACDLMSLSPKLSG